MENKINGYELSRQWFDWCFENPEKISPNHTAMYFFIIEHCNRLGWKEKFGLPMEMTKNAIGIKNYKTYSKTYNDLIDFGFIKEIQKSKNQYSSCIIALVKNTNAHTKALSKATLKHSKKHYQSIVCIDKPVTIKPEKKEKDTNTKVFGEYGNVKLEDTDYDKLSRNLLWKRDEYITKLDEYIETTGKKYSNHGLTMLAWARKAGDTTPRDCLSMSTKEWITFMKQLKIDKHDFMYEIIQRLPNGAEMYPTISLSI